MSKFSPLFVIYSQQFLSMKHLLFTLLSLVAFIDSTSAQLTEQQQIQKLNLAYQHIRNHYVDDILLKPLVDEAIRATLRELDPHSQYLTREEMEKFRARLNGEFAGVGIRYIVHNDTLVVRSVLPNSPASRVGIMPNDRIVSIDNNDVVGIDIEEAQKLLQGAADSKLSIVIMRRKEHKPLSINIKRDYIENKGVSASYRIGDVGYIAISTFTKQLSSEVYSAYKALGDVKSLVIDLRDNGGGSLTAGIDLSSMFLTKGDLIASTDGKIGSNTYHKRQDRITITTPLVVIINEGSASASEIFAGAIQDHDRGVLVGRTSFGKALVQRIYDLKDGSGLILTIARTKTPSGRIIQRPYEMGKGEEYRKDKARYMHPDSISHDSDMIFRTLHSGRKVYGGGGITPDIYITPDSITLSQAIVEAHNSAIFEHAIIDYLDIADIDLLKRKHPVIEDFCKDYTLDNELLNIFNAYINEAELSDIDNRFIATMLKSLIAEHLYGSDARYYIYSIDFDDTLKQAIAIANNEELMHQTLTAH